MRSVAWDYEETSPPYYHIYSFNGGLDGNMPAWTMDLPLTDANSADVQSIVDILNRMAERVGQ